MSAAQPAHDQAGTPRNRQSRSAARVHRPWMRVPSGPNPRRRTPSDLASPTLDSPLPRETYSRANNEVLGGVQIGRRSVVTEADLRAFVTGLPSATETGAIRPKAASTARAAA